MFASATSDGVGKVGQWWMCRTWLVRTISHAKFDVGRTPPEASPPHRNEKGRGLLYADVGGHVSCATTQRGVGAENTKGEMWSSSGTRSHPPPPLPPSPAARWMVASPTGETLAASPLPLPSATRTGRRVPRRLRGARPGHLPRAGVLEHRDYRCSHRQLREGGLGAVGTTPPRAIHPVRGSPLVFCQLRVICVLGSQGCLASG